MKNLCDTRVHKDNEGYYVLYIADWTPKDLNAVMQARWLNLTYLANIWDNSQVASEVERGVLHPTLAKDLYTLPLRSLWHRRPSKLRWQTMSKMMFELGEATRRLDQANKELNKAWTELTDSQRQIKEQKASCRKADNDLLKIMKENETLKAELPSKSILAFKLGYPDLEVDSDLFTEKPEDSSVPIETRQEFNDSIPTEE
ncbi:hypothetical protein B296_00054704 [Ensete ventricosum]|uniref:Uncharacterized protein n=1 Tax=Ensete ventricosum TaxID=4639 RepID=A0A426X2Q5_ENSVE|nr:hypothetical protein B296_00054704 [Ensete ventricosum]